MDGKDFKKITSPKNIYCLVSTDAEMVDLYVDSRKSFIFWYSRSAVTDMWESRS